MSRIHPALAPPMSFFSRRLYRDVAQSWKGLGFYYLLALVLACWFLVVLKIQIGLILYIRENFRGVWDQIPPFSIKNGRVETEAAQPQIIRNSAGEIAAILDTSGAIAGLEGTEARILLTRDRLFIRLPDGQIGQSGLARLEGSKLDGQQIKRYVRLLHLLMPLAFYPTGVAVFFALAAAHALALAAAAIPLARWSRARLGYGRLLRLAAIALTPNIALLTLSELLDAGQAWRLPAWPILAVGYMVYAVRANAGFEPEEPPEMEWGL